MGREYTEHPSWEKSLARCFDTVPALSGGQKRGFRRLFHRVATPELKIS
jgi:hypothetical protein